MEIYLFQESGTINFIIENAVKKLYHQRSLCAISCLKVAPVQRKPYLQNKQETSEISSESILLLVDVYERYVEKQD